MTLNVISRQSNHQFDIWKFPHKAHMISYTVIPLVMGLWRECLFIREDKTRIWNVTLLAASGGVPVTCQRTSVILRLYIVQGQRHIGSTEVKESFDLLMLSSILFITWKTALFTHFSQSDYMTASCHISRLCGSIGKQQTAVRCDYSFSIYFRFLCDRQR